MDMAQASAVGSSREMHERMRVLEAAAEASRRKYEEVYGIPSAMSMVAVGDALSRLEFNIPCLYVSNKMLGMARLYSQSYGISYQLDDSLEDWEWFIDFNGKRVGSKGC